jgi:hypothetical protein
MNMQRISSACIGAAALLAMVAGAAPAQAASIRAAPVMAAEQGPAIQQVGDRWDHGRKWKHRRDRDHFSFGFGVPFAYYPSYPTYAYRSYACPYGYRYDHYRHACVGNSYSYGGHPYHYRSRPGFSIQFGF